MVSSHHLSPTGSALLGRPSRRVRTALSCPGQLSAALDQLEDRIVRIDHLAVAGEGDPGTDTTSDVPGSNEPPD